MSEGAFLDGPLSQGRVGDPTFRHRDGNENAECFATFNVSHSTIKCMFLTLDCSVDIVMLISQSFNCTFKSILNGALHVQLHTSG